MMGRNQMSEIVTEWNGWIGMYPTVAKMVTVTVVLFLTIGVVMLIKSRINSSVKESTTRYKMRKAVTLLAYFVFAVVVLAVFKKDMSGFAVAIGVIGGRNNFV